MTEFNIGFDFTEQISKGALLTAMLPCGKINTMTVSWGEAGVLWGKRVCTLFVRQTRYTFPFLEDENAQVTLSFLDEGNEKTLSFCGTRSGKDTDKIKACKLDYTLNNGACVFDCAHTTLVLKKLYFADLIADGFVDSEAKACYPNGSFHRAYTYEIIDIITK